MALFEYAMCSSLEEYANDRPFIEEIDTFIYELWKVLDSKYTPKEGKR